MAKRAASVLHQGGPKLTEPTVTRGAQLFSKVDSGLVHEAGNAVFFVRSTGVCKGRSPLP